jgi:nicotinamide riboside transporter PnuC
VLKRFKGESVVELLATLGRTLGFSFAAGINLYATVAILGLAKRYGWVVLPEQFAAFDNDLVIGVAIVLYVVEFVADKVPWVDSLWDGLHTVIRPVGGALIAVTTLGEASPTIEGLVALLGGAVAAGTHFTKAGTRAVANTSPEPFSNWALSLSEDVFVVGLAALALKYPAAAAVVVLAGVVLMLVFATWIVRAVKRRWAARAPVAITP